MTTDEGASRSDALLLKEYDQAWEHFRHLETQRSHHLGFLFTVAFAAVAYVVTFHHALADVWEGVAVAGIALLVTVLACFTYIDVRKFGVALTHNQSVVHRIRARFLDDLGQDLESIWERRLDLPRQALLRSRLFSVQGTAEFTCLLAGATAAAANIALAIHFLLQGASAGGEAVLVLMAVAGVVLVAGVAAVGSRPYWVGL